MGQEKADSTLEGSDAGIIFVIFDIFTDFPGNNALILIKKKEKKSVIFFRGSMSVCNLVWIQIKIWIMWFYTVTVGLRQRYERQSRFSCVGWF